MEGEYELRSFAVHGLKFVVNAVNVTVDDRTWSKRWETVDGFLYTVCNGTRAIFVAPELSSGVITKRDD